MHKTLRLCIHLACIAGLLAMFLLSGDKYDVLYAMDPSIPPGSIEGGGSGRVVTVAIFLAIVLLQIFAMAKATRMRERWLPAVLMLSGALLLVFA
ncbi:hypothetical protein QRO11_06935 [Paracidovorax citrulli]|uniref:Uncharacterized protein n=2 Tax=Paracidovorax citrulli TaxID=80869 RepID=A1TST9_PARC0|nr:hypothetical protein [Paracidovorax citrulli]ABM34027.1 hypothetical protein Aave_3470 [Paracidovorax citrulli AAC00-1]ATG93550.1 hypothetical protein CQB05_05440 [Paracidovorax citrulli]MVT27843.1 hypothetical protein [Paracidovorax citrulli]PVY63466.1 hypothetical protein C8E08_0752 [Paracidovorax citrulli]REG67567.1 hypothetical protein C8E07_0637 [Paracidovorax citrulli]